ncbi:MAG TPA: molecular chaperone TorD family protein [Pyrinomonadaceae bacterium]|nr:molecular chaperone TorD family protein [Pyrinomonadaceae bacterium]
MELFRALAVLVEPPDRDGAGRVAEALGLGALPEPSEYTELFAFQLYPYASVYAGAEGMLGGEARSRVADFMGLLGIRPPSEPDHLAVLLAAYAGLCESDEGGAAREAFLWEHLLSWLPAYLEKLSELAPPFYRRWGGLLMKALLEEVGRTGPPASLPLHLREAPPLADPRGGEGAEEFSRSLLAPARSGMILTRADLARAGRSLGTGLRAGGRAFALRSLLGQDTAAAFGWLAAEAEGWAGRHLKHREALGAVSEWWAGRARDAAGLLRELQEEAARNLSEEL